MLDDTFRRTDFTDSEPTQAARDGRVRRRRVFFVSGFDPHGPRRYHRLYREEAERQAAISGYEVSTGRLNWPGEEPEAGGPWFSVSGRSAGGAGRAVVENLRWDDIAREQMRRSTLSIYGLMVRALWRFAVSGALGGMIRLRKSVVIAAFYPVGLALFYLAASLGLGLGAASVFADMLGLPLWTGAPAGLVVAAAALTAARRMDRHAYAFYLICDYAHAAAHAEGGDPELDRRMEAFGRRIAAVWALGDCDEVLVVGHSSGAQVAVQALAAALRVGAGATKGPKLSLLTLGQAIQMSSLLPGAAGLRRDLAFLGDSDLVDWVDVTAPADGACFALTDPVAATGARPGLRNPKIISAAFRRTLSPATRRRLRWRYFRRHHQYLRAFERPGDYDYFAITAGPLSLAARFAARGSSPKAQRRSVRSFAAAEAPA